MSIAIVGDPHLREDNIRSRKDDYFEAFMFKLTTLLSRHDHVLFLGDFFNSPRASVPFLNKVISRLLPYRGRIHTILGNHDCYYRTLDLDKTAIGILAKSQIITIHQEHGVIEDLGFDIATVVPELKLPEKKHAVLLAHTFFEDKRNPRESLSLSDIHKYECVFMGHDHMYRDSLDLGVKVIRTGSLMRTEANENTLNQTKVYYTSYSAGEFNLEYLDIENPREVFRDEYFDRTIPSRIEVTLPSIIDVLDGLNFSIKDDTMSTEVELIKLNCPSRSVEFLRLVHENLGLKF